MKRLARAVLALLLVVLAAAALTGCGGDQTEEANAAIDASNQAVEVANEYDAEAVKLFEQIGRIEPGAKSTDKALELIAQAEASIGKKNEQVQKAIDELRKIDGLDVSDDFKTYAEQQIEIAEMQRETNELLLKATTEFKKVFEVAGGSAPDMKALQESFRVIDDTFAEADRVSKSIDEKSEASDAFFQEKNLGE